MKINDILLFGGIGLALYLLLSKKSAAASPIQQASTDLGSALNKIFSPQYNPGATTPAQKATAGASVADYITASSKLIDSLTPVFRGSSVPSGAVTGPGEASYIPSAYDIDGNPTAYSATAMSERKKGVSQALARPSNDTYFRKYSFYN